MAGSFFEPAFLFCLIFPEVLKKIAYLVKKCASEPAVGARARRSTYASAGTVLMAPRCARLDGASGVIRSPAV